jgi:large subunit ribosomal protein L2
MSSLIHYRPYTASLRHMCLLNKRVTYKSKTLESLFSQIKNNSGRNHHGHISVRRKRGRHFKSDVALVHTYQLNNIIGFVEQLNYSPSRSSFIALVRFMNGVYCYLLAYEGIQLKDTIRQFKYLPELVYQGNSSYCAVIPAGSSIYNIESYPGHGGVYTKSAGTFSLLVNKLSDRVVVKLQSKKVCNLSKFCIAYLGRVGQMDNNLTISGKAGRSYHLGIRPSVRGVAMNPVDHPHGGGEGRKSKPRCPRNPFGKRMKWNRTRKFKKHKHDTIPL